MMDISKYIYDYLMEGNTSVIVPDLGHFSIVDKPSVIQDNIVIPPGKTVKFNCEDSEDNHVFTRYIAEKENITIEQAVQEVYRFYDHYFTLKLAEIGQPIVFENFGTFSLNDFHDIQFEPVTDFFKDSYGLGQVHISGEATIPPPFEDIPVIPEPEPVVPPESLEPEPVVPPESPEPKPVVPPESLEPDPVVPPVPPEPEPVVPPEPEPVVPPVPSEPEPVIPAEPEPVQPPSEPEQPAQETKKTSPQPGGSLFGASSNTRYRENTERRRPAVETPPAQPPKASKQSKPPKPQKPPKAPKPPKQPKAKKTGNSNLWVLWVLLIAVGLGAAGYFYYPEINKFLTKGRPVTIIAEPEAEPEDTGATDEDTPNAEVAQTLDEATDKRNALNPAGSQSTEPVRTPSTPVTQSVPQSQGSAGSGNWVLVAGSFRIQSNAEAFQRTLQAEGFSTEIILAKNQLYWVSVGSFNTLAEAQRQANQVRSKHDDVWVARR